MTCDWCGHEHAMTALCAKRPTWGRRGFLAMLGAAAVGAALPALPDPAKRFKCCAIDVAVGPDLSAWTFHIVQSPVWVQTANGWTQLGHGTYLERDGVISNVWDA